MRGTLIICLFFSISLFTISSGSAQSQRFQLQVEVANAAEGTIELAGLEFNPPKKVPMAEKELSSGAGFSGDYPIAEEALYLLEVGKKLTLILAVKPGENIKIKTDLNNISNTTLEGSSGSTVILSALRKEQTLMEKYVAPIEKKYKEALAAEDQETAQEAINSYEKVLPQLMNEYNAYLLENAGTSVAWVFFAEKWDDNTPIQFLDQVAERMKSVQPAPSYATYLLNRIEELKKTAVGTTAPEITLPTPQGDKVALSSLQGNYVLIDFWASWCKPCRIENPNVVKAYEKYHPKGFEIYGVALDKNKEAWLKAIEKDNLQWINVSDLQFWQSPAAKAYNVTAIPMNFLLDKEGKIIAKNLRGSRLEAKLAELFE
ncbi:MAG: TlpA family protein disulfide reductase [Thermonemataceae bacterium]|mgnify:CR=1 FL=1